jgi:drug/metabolite transporter (DMT)-like permease
MRVNRTKTLCALHLMLMIYSISGICSKLAGRYPFLSLKFCFFYGIVILLLGFYAIGWQQIIKRIPLTLAFANKAVTVIWGSIWGVLFFQETITVGKIIGTMLVVAGIVLYAYSDYEAGNG